MSPLITNMLKRIKYSSFSPLISRENVKFFSASVVTMDSQRPNFPLYSERGIKKNDKKLLEPFLHVQLPLDFYSKFTNAFNYWLKCPKRKEQEIFDLSFNLTCIYLTITDDIMDGSELREGKPLPHTVYGMGRTLNSVNYALFITLERVQALNHPEAANVYVQHLLDIHREQGMEVYWRDNFICPTEAEYRTMTIGKMGAFMNLCIALMQLYSERKDNFRPLVELIALYVQIRDDYCNLCSREFAEKKGFCEDIGEGKFSFPVVHAINSKADEGKVLSILKQRTRNINLKEHCLKLLDRIGSLAYTRKTMSDLDRQIREVTEKLGGNPQIISLLDDYMSDWKKGENFIIKP